MTGIEDLMLALSSDKVLSDKLAKATTPDAAVEIAKSAGYEVSVPELMEAYKSKMASMSEAELLNVSGGKGDGNTSTNKGIQQSGDGSDASQHDSRTGDGNLDGNTAGG